jgi:hypothetical protein
LSFHGVLTEHVMLQGHMKVSFLPALVTVGLLLGSPVNASSLEQAQLQHELEVDDALNSASSGPKVNPLIFALMCQCLRTYISFGVPAYFSLFGVLRPARKARLVICCPPRPFSPAAFVSAMRRLARRSMWLKQPENDKLNVHVHCSITKFYAQLILRNAAAKERMRRTRKGSKKVISPVERYLMLCRACACCKTLGLGQCAAPRPLQAPGQGEATGSLRSGHRISQIPWRASVPQALTGAFCGSGTLAALRSS